MPGIKSWTDGFETVDASHERPLTGAERDELERREHASKRLKLVERAAEAAGTFSAFMLLFVDNRVIRHRYDLAVIACAAVAVLARFIAKRLP